MARKPNRNKPNATGRNPTGRYVGLRFSLLESVAYRSLTPNARALLVELTMLHNGENNGSIYMALEDAAARMGVADPHTAAGAFNELQEAGFITMTRDAHFKVKAADRSRARTWRLNHLPGPGRRVADWDFLKRQPPAKTRANKRADRGCRALKRYRKARDAARFPDVEFSPVGADLAEVKPDTVRNFHTGATGNCGFPANDCMGNSHIYIANHGDTGAMETGEPTVPKHHENSGGRNSPLGWWQPDHDQFVSRLVYSAVLAKQVEEALAKRRAA